MITSFNTYSDTRLFLPCPNCKNNHEIGLLAFLAAVNRHLPVICSACDVAFSINVLCQTRDAEQRDAPTEAGGGELRKMDDGSMGSFDWSDITDETPASVGDRAHVVPPLCK